jgi:circadian clock protein KaiB
MPPTTLKLYIAGSSTRSERAVHHIEQIQAQWASLSLEIHVVDVLQNPAAAEAAHIIATPTLVREYPQPERRIIGDLSDLDMVLRVLNIRVSSNDEDEIAR